MGATLMTLGAGYSAFMLVITLVRVLMVMRYKTMASLPDAELPKVA